MSEITREIVLAALAKVMDREQGRDVVSLGMISGVAIKGGKVGFLVTIDAKDKDRKAYLQGACEAAVKSLPGVESVTVVITAENPAPVAGSGARDRQTPPSGGVKAVWNKNPVEGVKKMIAIASGKGGVGKSTTAVNLALALKNMGKRVGLLDADIYGPSIPRMMGLSGKPEIADNKMIPLIAHGIECMSVGFLIEGEAAILRGPMISKTLAQLLRATRWNNLDILLVDMPPGTGDTHLSLAQQAPLDGAIIVTTPQEVAVMDARKCLVMFQKVNVPILGVIENMSGGIFGSGGGEKLAQEMNVPFLGAIPMDAAIVTACDAGIPYTGKAYEPIANQVP